MKFYAFCAIASLTSLTAFAAAPDPEAKDLLARASAAYNLNQTKELHWNWISTEQRQLAGKAGGILQIFPTVTAESVIRNTGQRCNAVVGWGDGLAPFKLHASADERCSAMDNFRPPFDLAELLKSGQVRMLEEWQNGVAISILPDKVRQRSEDPAVRCAASIEANVKLDYDTLFPVSIEGKVVDSGCEMRLTPVIQYGKASNNPMRPSFRKGASFRMEFALQKDKFGNKENSFWIAANQHYLMPWDSENAVLFYWGRQVGVKAHGQQLVKDIATKAQEFGAGSQLRFDTQDDTADQDK